MIIPQTHQKTRGRPSRLLYFPHFSPSFFFLFYLRPVHNHAGIAGRNDRSWPEDNFRMAQLRKKQRIFLHSHPVPFPNPNIFKKIHKFLRFPFLSYSLQVLSFPPARPRGRPVFRRAGGCAPAVLCRARGRHSPEDAAAKRPTVPQQPAMENQGKKARIRALYIVRISVPLLTFLRRFIVPLLKKCGKYPNIL